MERKEIIVVVGGGFMGRWIAYLFALAGCRVVIIDKEAQALQSAREWMSALLLKDKNDPSERETVLARITFLPGEIDDGGAVDAALASGDLVIEAVPERLPVKRPVLAVLDRLCKLSAILASTSSSIMMSEIDEACVRHRGRTMNLHFFPVPRRTVELMGGTDTDVTLLEEVAALLTACRLIPFVVRGKRRGFIFNELWHYIKKGVLKQLADGISRPADIDRLWMLNFGMAMGPCMIMDLVGLDVVLDIERIYWADSDDPDDEPPKFLAEWVAAGRLGRKSGQGFYTYGVSGHPEFEQPGWLTGEVDRKVPFQGTWRLASFVMLDPGGTVLGHPMGGDAQGTLIYTATDVAVILARAGREKFGTGDPHGGSDAQKAGAYDSAVSYFGTYTVEDGRVVHRVSLCTFPDWSGQEQVRNCGFDGGKLVLETPLVPHRDDNVRYRLEWTRA